ncbi:hypothetical protein AA309_02340 [Microvirga vignae]|uniref:Uncharacterized protein n=1 Tax=Microvirga vignae TaxID=1225564 RepID=A0A0H1RPP0_9HYPH|nr:hypothetical protein [Microvirga vignae]KLK94647.1 hypothetical protein AA309_02340 [Microvirga vignae]
MRRISCRASYGPGLIGVQTGACIVRQAQEQTGPESIRPDTVSSKLAVTPAGLEVHNNVRWVNLIWGLKDNPQERACAQLEAGSQPDPTPSNLTEWREVAMTRRLSS